MPLTGMLYVSRPWVCGCTRPHVRTFTPTRNITVMVIRGFQLITPSFVRQSMDIPRGSGGQVLSRYMSTSGKAPEWSSEGSSIDNGKKLDSTEVNPSNERMEKWRSYMQEKSPEMYNLGQRLSEKSSSIVNSIVATSANQTQREEKPEDWNDILNRWYQQYLDFIGITDLKKAQDSVTELSEMLSETQGKRRLLQAETEDLQERVVVNHQGIAKTEQYSQEHFFLFDQAREMNERLKVVKSEFNQCERTERDTFTQLSAAIRDCHEKERMQAEQSKYWSIIASVVSAALASIITSVNNWVRIREIKDHVSSTNFLLLQGYRQMHTDVLASLSPPTGLGVHAMDEGVPVESASEVLKAEKQLVSASEVSGSGKMDPEQILSGEGIGGLANGVSLKKHSEKACLDLSESSSLVVDSREVAPRPLTATLPQEDLSRISEKLYHSLWQQISTTLTGERERLREQVEGQLEAVISRVEVEGDRARKELEALGKAISKLSASTISLEAAASSQSNVTLETAKTLGSAIAQGSPVLLSCTEKGQITASDYSFRLIASAMAVGAGIGTLATAFVLKSLGGSAGV